MYLLLQSYVQATDKRIDSVSIFLPAKTICHEIKNEMRGCHILQSGRPGIYTYGLDGQAINSRHEKTSYVPNYVFFTLLHEWVDRGQTHQLEKLLCV